MNEDDTVIKATKKTTKKTVKPSLKEPPKRRLYRSRKERVIAGICGGLAEYFDIDPTWMRLIFVLLLIFGGSAILIYLIMWLVVPLEPIEPV